MIRRSLNTLTRAQHGATAIEYAIIAGLIGLGLVGSLVTTRGSLSGIFGTAATKMASGASAAAPAANLDNRPAYWQAKGSPTVTSGSNFVNWAYPDGSVVRMVTGDPSFPYRFIITDRGSQITALMYYLPSGAIGLSQMADYYDSAMSQRKTDIRTTTGADFSTSGVPTKAQVTSYETNGAVIGSPTSGPPSADYLLQIQRSQNDVGYFTDLAS